MFRFKTKQTKHILHFKLVNCSRRGSFFWKLYVPLSWLCECLFPKLTLRVLHRARQSHRPFQTLRRVVIIVPTSAGIIQNYCPRTLSTLTGFWKSSLCSIRLKYITFHVRGYVSIASALRQRPSQLQQLFHELLQYSSHRNVTYRTIVVSFCCLNTWYFFMITSALCQHSVGITIAALTNPKHVPWIPPSLLC